VLILLNLFICGMERIYGRLGHVNMASIRKLRNKHFINVSDKNNCSQCSICVEAKYTKKPFKSIMNRTTELLELIHSDLSDFKNTTSR
jgi:hypothetical protein